MVWIHTSRSRIDSLLDDAASNNCAKQHKYMMKPAGLWLGYGNSWLNWQKIEMPEWYDSIKFIYKMNFMKDINVLTINSLEDLNNFIDTYGYTFKQNSFKTNLIDWKKVCEKYDGIIFKNFDKIKEKIYPPFMMDYNQFRKAYELYWEKYSWYSFIDIDSACIFRPSQVISSFSLIKEIKK